jgi:hypothetical protein
MPFFLYALDVAGLILAKCIVSVFDSSRSDAFSVLRFLSVDFVRGYTLCIVVSIIACIVCIIGKQSFADA